MQRGTTEIRWWKLPYSAKVWIYTKTPYQALEHHQWKKVRWVEIVKGDERNNGEDGFWVKVEATNWILILSLSKFWPSQGKWGESGVMVECSREQKMWLERFFLLHGWPPSIGGRGLCHDGLWGFHECNFTLKLFTVKIKFKLVLRIKSIQLKLI